MGNEYPKVAERLWGQIPDYELTGSTAYDLVGICLHDHLEWARPFFVFEGQIRMVDDLRRVAGSFIIHAGVDKALSFVCLLAYLAGELPPESVRVKSTDATLHGSLECRLDFGVKVDELSKLGFFASELASAGDWVDPREQTLKFLQLARNDFVHSASIYAGLSFDEREHTVELLEISSDYSGGTHISSFETFERLYKWIGLLSKSYVEARNLDDLISAIEEEIKSEADKREYAENYANKVGWETKLTHAKINALNAVIFDNKWQSLIERARERLRS